MSQANNTENNATLRQFKPYPAYKVSSVEWLGEVPRDWEVKRLKFVATVNDEVLTESTDPELEITYVDISSVGSMEGITNEETLAFDKAPSRARRIVRHGDVIVSTVRTYLRAIAPIEDPEPNLIVSTGFAVIRPRLLDSSFAAYAFRAPYFVERVVANSVGVSYPAINAGDLACFPIVIPNLDEQRTIAIFLDREMARIDALVAKKERLIELLQEKRTALITRAVTNGLDPNVPMKDSGVEWLEDIPAHWEVKRLRHLLKARKGAIKTGPFGSQLQSSEMQAGEIKVYNQRSVLDRDFSGEETYISLEKFEELRAFETFPGDLLITTRGSIGRAAILPQNAERGILHPCLMRVQLDQQTISPRFVENQFEGCAIVLEQLRFMSNATTIDVIYSESLKDVWLVVPPLDEQTAIVSFAARETAKLDKLIAKVRDAIDRLKELRTSLISAAVTGKIDVREEVA